MRDHGPSPMPVGGLGAVQSRAGQEALVRTRGFTTLELIIVVTIIAVIIAIAVPSVISARKSAHEGQAIGALKTLANAQQMFREGDHDGDNLADFGDLMELSNTTMVDSILGSGRKAGYLFDTDAGSTNRQFAWFALANPSVPTQTGDKYFCTNQRGVIYFTQRAAVPPNYVDCSIPAGLAEVH
jgi:type IV pilus assembly protein PilA